jgi:hypothetical protein
VTSVPIVVVPLVAVTLTRVIVPTGLVEASKVADVEPADTTMDAGTETTAELDLRLTLRPPAGAAALRVTVPVVSVPPMILLGLKASELNFGA